MKPLILAALALGMACGQTKPESADKSALATFATYAPSESMWYVGRYFDAFVGGLAPVSNTEWMTVVPEIQPPKLPKNWSSNYKGIASDYVLTWSTGATFNIRSDGFSGSPADQFQHAWHVLNVSREYTKVFSVYVNAEPVATVYQDGSVTIGLGWTAEQALALVAGQTVRESEQRSVEASHEYEQHAIRAFNNTHPHTVDRSPEHHKALVAAWQSWKSVLGPSYTVPLPKLMVGGLGACDTRIQVDAIACIDVKTRSFIILDDITGKSYDDLRTIFMHEIGHIIGVPHIEGDPLMNAQYIGPISIPSRQAVALAKLMEDPK